MTMRIDEMEWKLEDGLMDLVTSIDNAKNPDSFDVRRWQRMARELRELDRDIYEAKQKARTA